MNEEDESSPPGKISAWAWPIVCAAICLGLGIASGLSSVSGTGTWYQGLIKPFGNPPPSVFPPVWSVLYILMGISLGRLIHRRATAAIVLFVIQFLLNLAWTPTFFGAHKVGWALAIIFGIWGFLALTIRSAEKVDRVAAFLLIPYLVWIMYATYLNAAIGWLNRS